MLNKRYITEGIAFIVVSLVTILLAFNNYVLTLPWIFTAFFLGTGYLIFTGLAIKQLSRGSEKLFRKRLFRYSLLTNFVVMMFLFIFNMAHTGTPFSVNAKDEIGYDSRANTIADNLISQGKIYENIDYDFADLGYPTILGIEYLMSGRSIYFSRLIQILLGALSVLFTYRIAKNFFDPEIARVAGALMIFYPHLLYFQGVTLKEGHMVFLLTATFLLASNILKKRLTVGSLVLIIITTGLLFSFRTPLAVLAILSIVLGLVFTKAPKKRGGAIMYVFVFTVLLLVFARSTGLYYSTYETISTSGEMYERVTEKRAMGGGSMMSLIGLPIYVVAAVPTPFPSLVDTEQDPTFHKANWYHSGGSFVWNILSFFFLIGIVFAVRKHFFRYLMIITFTIGYLMILSYSGYVTSLRYTVPVIPFLLIFAALGLYRYRGKIQLYRLYLLLMYVCVVGWAYFQLASRGMI